MTTYARFAASPTGPTVLATDGGLSLTTSGAATLNQFGRSDIGVDSGRAGAEFYFWGSELQGAGYNAAVGLVPGTADPATSISSSGLEWRVGSGEVYFGPTLQVSRLPILAKGDIAGMRVTLGQAETLVELYRNGALIHSGSVALTGPLHFAVSLVTAAAGGMHCIVNAGQWQGRGDAVNFGGWKQAGQTMDAVRLSVEPYMSAATDDPPSAAYLDLVAGDGLDAVASVSFWPWDSSTRAGSGALKLQDADGFLDAMAMGDVRDTPVQVRQVIQGQPLSTARPVSRYVLERIDVEDDGRKTAILRDPHDDLDSPLHRAVFLPSINDQVAWQPQPVVIGAVRSAPAISVNSDGSVRWLADAAVASIGKVIDRGANIASGDGYELVAGRQQLSFDAPPVGPVLVDLSSVGPGMQPARLEQALGEVFRRINKSAWNAADAREIDLATGYAGIGYYAGTGSTPRQALAEILPSYGADWWQDADGVLRLARLVDPDSVPESDLAFDLDWRELAGDLVTRPDMAPSLSRRMAYQRNAELLASGDMITDLALLPSEQRLQLSGEFRGQVYAGGRLAARYTRAESAPPMVSRFDRREDAQAEIDRIIAIYQVPRHFYDGRLSGRTDITFRPGQVGRLTYPRYGLQAGRRVLVASVLTNPVQGTHTVRFWGA